MYNEFILEEFRFAPEVGYIRLSHILDQAGRLTKVVYMYWELTKKIWLKFVQFPQCRRKKSIVAIFIKFW